MVMADFDLRAAIQTKRLVIEPFHDDSIRENGIDFRLDDEIARHKEFYKDFTLDPTDESHVNNTYEVTKKPGSMVIKPHEQVLLSTVEYLEMPDDVVGFVELRSSWARHGLSMPPTIVDAGFKGTITLEVVNNAPYAIRLLPGMRFAHIIFIKTNNRVGSAYSGTYNGQRGVRLPKVLEKK
ncbi:MAG: dCTP deaminase [Candidatus Micrarchaeota archaeon]|nr:dCTP deaminase [Candidatus Micrarchaeota archaeon]